MRLGIFFWNSSGSMIYRWLIFLVKARGTGYCCWRVAQLLLEGGSVDYWCICVCVFLFFGSKQEVQATVVGWLNANLSPFLSIDRRVEPQR